MRGAQEWCVRGARRARRTHSLVAIAVRSKPAMSSNDLNFARTAVCFATAAHLVVAIAPTATPRLHKTSLSTATRRPTEGYSEVLRGVASRGPYSKMGGRCLASKVGPEWTHLRALLEEGRLVRARLCEAYHTACRVYSASNGHHSWEYVQCDVSRDTPPPPLLPVTTNHALVFMGACVRVCVWGKRGGTIRFSCARPLLCSHVTLITDPLNLCDFVQIFKPQSLLGVLPRVLPDHPDA